ncbi:MAG: hypothetical protein KGM47_10055 [Acidobacteriota bacterium]|nr:hypothetical protein [Acidobacteriota bacterium]
MKKSGKRALTRRRRLYAAAVWLLFAAQLNLVFAAELHQHGYPFLRSQEPSSVSSSSSSKPLPAPADGSHCIVCQIVRQSAARPATTGYTARPSNRVIYHFVLSTFRLSNIASVILPARAPPATNYL